MGSWRTARWCWNWLPILKKEEDMKNIRVWMLFAIAIITAVATVAGGHAITSYKASENKIEVSEIEEKVDACETEYNNLNTNFEVYKAEQHGELRLLKKDIQDVNRKLDAIIEAWNKSGGIIICEPVENYEKKTKP